MSGSEANIAKWIRAGAGLQALYFIATGLWPFLHPHSFELVTDTRGPLWAFRSVGVLITVVGLVILDGCRHRIVDRTLCLVGGLSALGLVVIDLYLISEGVIGRLNLLDVVLQMAFATAWIFVSRRLRPAGSQQ